MKLNLGCGITKFEEWVNVDTQPGADSFCDLRVLPWPWENESVDEVRADHLVEHLPELAPFMNECHRILKPDGVLTVTTPHPLYEWFWQDPTHLHGYTRNTFAIYCTGHPKTLHTEIIPWSSVETSERIFRVNEVQACEVTAVLRK